MLTLENMKENLHFRINSKRAFSKKAYVLAILLTTSACGGVRDLAPVHNFGLSSDSKTGSIIVSEGDTLWNISKRYRVPLRAILDINNISSPYNLSSGQRLKIPPPVEYKVRSGDTLTTIANLFDVSVYDLARVNHLSSPYVISVDKYIRIPSKYTSHEQLEVAGRTNNIKYKEVKVKGSVSNKLIATALVETVPIAPRHVARRPENIKVAQKSGGFIWPVQGKIISSYGAKDGGLHNDGINIAVPRKEPVMAASEGVVAYVGADLKSYGNLILIKHAGGYMTAYAHLDNIRVVRNEEVKRGQVIGAVGSTGNVSSPQLHFEVRKGSRSVNPMNYLK